MKISLEIDLSRLAMKTEEILRGEFPLQDSRVDNATHDMWAALLGLEGEKLVDAVKVLAVLGRTDQPVRLSTTFEEPE